MESPIPQHREPQESSQERAGVWIVVPAYNEGKRLPRVLEALTRLPVTVVAVDDGSRDDTAEVASRFPGVWVLRHVINLGQGAALQTGFDFALRQGAQIVVTFDADGQHDAADVERLVEPIVTGRAEVVLGSRFLGRSEGIPWRRWLLLKAAVLFTRIVSRVRVSDTHNGLRAFSRQALRCLRITQNRMAHASQILDQIHQHRLRYVEVPCTVRYTAETLAKGQSSWNAIHILWELLMGRVIR